MTEIQRNDPRMVNFWTLDAQQRTEAIRRMRALGWSIDGIARATMLATEQIQQIVGHQEPTHER